jgi:hypothetical protein
MEEPKGTVENLHTEEMQDIIGKPPVWLYRWGISLVLSVVLVCIGISSFITYPEVVKTQLKIRSVYSPAVVSCPDSVRIFKILIPNDHEIVKDQYLAELEGAKGMIRIKASQDGKLTYAGIIHENMWLKPNQPIFYISRGSSDFYGEMVIPKNSINKVKAGKKVLIELNGFSDEGHKTLRGTIRYITDDLNNGGHIAEVDFDGFEKGNSLPLLKNGAVTDAGIITAQATVFQRIMQGLLKKPR